ncbi:MAG: minichromosome maintenance protein MCM [Candidatus Marsarchaeota archaeon]|nr:minichromosome maintenance protein MCM [Candidatus Marsarchaeota archaeon]MCL5094801.1 minichromosome maintenance protein MCM [Candidatus Marsarchaeota archaeon]
MDALSETFKAKFDDFFERFYRTEIDSLIISFPEKRSLNIDIKDLEKFDPNLAYELIEKPDIILNAANESLKQKIESIEEEKTNKEVHARFFGQNIYTPLVQDVGSDFINKMILLDCLIVKRSEISPMVKIGVFKCSYCNSIFKFRLDKDEVPDLCPQCKRKSLKQSQEDAEFINMQKIAIQDPLEKLRGNSPTWQLEVWIEDDLVNTVIPGDRIDLTGILRIRQRKPSHGKKANETNLYTMYVNTVSIIPKQKEFAELSISDEEERLILEFSKDPNIFEKIGKSIAPSVYGHDEIKQAIALQLFGGTSGKVLIDGGLIRSDIHVLLIGDPGSAKTRILQTVTKLVPKGIYVSGKSVTGGGMTAVAERDDFSEGGWTLKAGALVLGSGGIVCIDEFDKIGDEDRASLHEALESQTVSVAKAGIIATFNAKASVLAAANPKYGRFDQTEYPSEQFNIPPTLLSRFDLIFPITDIADEELDKNIATHILIQHSAVSNNFENENKSKNNEENIYREIEKPPIDSELLRKYIAYAKKNRNPKLSNEASDKIKTYYIELRKSGKKEGYITITPRQIEGLVRMAEASAKTRLSDNVEGVDAERAINLAEFMFKTLTVDKSGRRDIDTLLTGLPKEKVDKLNAIINIIKKLEQDEGYAKMQRIIEEAEKANIDSGTANKYINDLERSGDIFMPKPGIIKVVRRENE